MYRNILGDSLFERPIKDWTADDIRRWARRVRVVNKKEGPEFLTKQDNLAEVIAVIDQAIRIKKGFSLRENQKLSIAMFLRNGGGMLQQLSTGEGKTMIIAALSIIKALCGENIDVITSSSVLAERDALENSDLYDLFGVTVGHNCSESKEERKKAYVNKMVVFGEIGSFQRDILLDTFYDEELGIGSRKKGFVIVDEVDSMLLDKGQNSLYLSHSIPGLDSLEDVYVQIWILVHGADVVDGPTAENIGKVRECMHNALYGTLRKIDIINSLGDEKASVRTEDVWRNLVDKGIIDDQGRILLRDELLDNKVSLQDIGEIAEDAQGAILCKLKDIVRQGIYTPVPKYLLDFIETHLDAWIENAFRAKWMVQNDQYVIDLDRSDATCSLVPNVVIMDKDTGVEQYHSQWNNGLHQFLQLKHNCRLSYESLKAVFMSNVSFFTQYDGRLFGLTGTLGSLRERDLLKEIYDVDYATVPSFRPTRLIEEMAKPCSSESEWIKEIVDTSLYRSKAKNRPVLVICESVRDVEILEKSFAKSGTGDVKMHVYKRSFEPLDVGCESPIDGGCIILATNLAGRGTDIKISDSVDRSGGLHVCLTYLPPSYRVEEQAFGRAARKGQEGSGQLVYRAETDDGEFETQHDEFHAIVLDKVKRDLKEERHIDQIKKNYECSIKKEEELFNRFRDGYQTLKSKLKKTRKYDQQQSAIILQSCLDAWAFLLDKYSMQSGEHGEEATGKCGIETFLAEMKKAGQGDSSLQSFQDVILCSPAARTKMAKELIRKKKFKEAEKIFDQLISQDENFSEAAHYYKCFCIVKRRGGLNKAENKSLFIHHLHKAEEKFEERIEKLSDFASIVSKIGELYKTERASFLHANDFGNQKEDMIQLYSGFLRSIQEITGYEVTENGLESCLNDPVLAWHAIDVLQRRNILREAHIPSPISPERNRQIRDRYQLYFRELEPVLKRCSQNRANVTADTFRNILPNREEFWEQMVKARLFDEEKEYVLLDKDALKKANGEFHANLYEEMCKLHSCDDFKHISCGSNAEEEGGENSLGEYVCLFPEQLDDIKSGKLTAISLDEFKKMSELAELKNALKELGVLKVNKICRFTFRKDENTRQARLTKYDILHKDMFFDEIDGIDRNTSHQIFLSLQKNRIISYGGPRGRLLVDAVTADSVKLTCCRNYETEILNVLKKHFSYRLALNELIQSRQISLDSEPHKHIYDDLVRMHVIEPVKVNDSLSEGQIKKEIRSLCKRSSSLSRLTEQSNDKDKQRAFADVCSDVDSKSMPHRFQSVEGAVKYHQRWADVMAKVKERLVSQLQAWKSGMSKFDRTDSNLVDVAEQFDLEFKSRISEELSTLESNGLSQVISLCEEKWSIWAMLKVAAIGFIGLAQITLGAVIELFTLGAGTHFAAGLIGEGTGDIMFAIESAASGFCTWLAYAKHKVFSVLTTVVTAGVGAYFSRGAKFSRYGYKIGGDFMRTTAGKELLKQAGKKRVIKEIAKRAGKKMIEATALGLTNVGVDCTLKNLLDSTLRSFAKELAGKFNKIEHNEALRKILLELCQKVGVEKAEAIVNQINKELFEKSSDWHEAIDKICSVLSKVTGAVTKGLSEASEKLSRCGNSSKAKLVSTVATNMSKVDKLVSGFERTKTMNEIESIGKEFTSRLEKKLNEVNAKMTQVEGLELDEKQADEFCKKMTKQWKDHVDEVVHQKISSELVEPAMKQMAHKLVRTCGQKIKNQYNKFQNSLHKKELACLMANKEKQLASAKTNEHPDRGPDAMSDVVHDDYIKALTALQKKTRDPKLLAEIIREGAPTGIHCVQAIAEHFQRPVTIKTTGGDGTMSMPEEFNPSKGTREGVKPIELDFEVGEGGSFGHFKTKHTVGDGDSLLKAVFAQTGQEVSRDKIARIVETNPLIKDRIKAGIHDHFMGKGAIAGPGVKRTTSQKIKLDRKINNLQTKGTRVRKDLEKMKPRLRDRPAKEKSINSNVGEGTGQSGTGNNEASAVSSFENLYDKSQRQKIEHPDASFDFLACYAEVRVDKRYVIWQHEDGSIQGYAGAIRSVKIGIETTDVKIEMETKTKEQYVFCTKGQPAFHAARKKAIDKASTAQQAAVAGLTTHLKNVIHPDVLRKLDITQPCYTSNGLDLSNKEHKKRFLIGYEREYYKIARVVKRLNNDERIPGLKTSLPGHLKHDRYLNSVDMEVKSTNPSEVKKLGKILREPAPDDDPITPRNMFSRMFPFAGVKSKKDK